MFLTSNILFLACHYQGCLEDHLVDTPHVKKEGVQRLLLLVEEQVITKTKRKTFKWKLKKMIIKGIEKERENKY